MSALEPARVMAGARAALGPRLAAAGKRSATLGACARGSVRRPLGKPRGPLRVAFWWVVYLAVLWPVRFLFGWLCPAILQHVWRNGVWYHIAQDDQPVYEGVRCVADEFPYGPHFRETMDVLVPCSSSRTLRGPQAVLYDLLCLVLCYPLAAWHYVRRRVVRRELREIAGARGFPAMCFVHGGGWVAIDASLQHHQSTALVRALGVAIYTINYPHAPESPFPHSTLSTLRALRFLREEQGHTQVTLVGESAGGNLATVVAGLLADRALLEDFCRRCRDDYGFTAPEDDPRRWSFPDVVACVSWYGICDVEAWVGAGWLWRGLNWVYDCHKGDSELPPVLRHGPDFDWALSRSAQDLVRRKARHEDPFMTVTCMARRFTLREYPPLLLTAGATDPLGLLHSSEEAYQALRAHFPSRPAEGRLLRAYHDSTHAFIGLNPFILRVAQGANWRAYAQIATDETIEFLRMHVPAFKQHVDTTDVARSS